MPLTPDQAKLEEQKWREAELDTAFNEVVKKIDYHLSRGVRKVTLPLRKLLGENLFSKHKLDQRLEDAYTKAGWRMNLTWLQTNNSNQLLDLRLELASLAPLEQLAEAAE